MLITYVNSDQYSLFPYFLKSIQNDKTVQMICVTAIKLQQLIDTLNLQSLIRQNIVLDDDFRTKKLGFCPLKQTLGMIDL